MRSGVITLRSGEWDWHMERAPMGSNLVFRRWSGSEEEMTAWVAGYDITPEALDEAGRDPLRRTWNDSVGLVWQLTLEAVRPWKLAREGVAPGLEGDSVVVFARGWHKRAAGVPRDTHLGELTQGELGRLFEASGNWR